MRSTWQLILLIFIYSILFSTSPLDNIHAQQKELNSIYEKRMDLYKKTETLTQIPWYYIAAIDQYERQIQTNLPDDQLISIRIAPETWYGLGNILHRKEAQLISLFSGKGKDGDGDGYADSDNPEDILFTMAQILLEYGPTKEDINIALWNYYKRELTVQTIRNTAKVFKQFQHIHFTDRSFPVSLQHSYSYQSTFGAPRGFGGLRIHEGTDIFANYGAPVLSTTYGVVEMLGWNLYGGWRIGIRDIYNIYHYYAHLNGYKDKVELGMVVKPGDMLGSVGSSGYGPPGTSGKFPPHLHYGMYKDNGEKEWAFDPYPYLRKWERIGASK